MNSIIIFFKKLFSNVILPSNLTLFQVVILELYERTEKHSRKLLLY